jgi:hypothetical protein
MNFCLLPTVKRNSSEDTKLSEDYVLIHPPRIIAIVIISQRRTERTEFHREIFLGGNPATAVPSCEKKYLL